MPKTRNPTRHSGSHQSMIKASKIMKDLGWRWPDPAPTPSVRLSGVPTTAGGARVYEGAGQRRCCRTVGGEGVEEAEQGLLKPNEVEAGPDRWVTVLGEYLKFRSFWLDLDPFGGLVGGVRQGVEVTVGSARPVHRSCGWSRLRRDRRGWHRVPSIRPSRNDVRNDVRRGCRRRCRLVRVMPGCRCR